MWPTLPMLPVAPIGAADVADVPPLTLLCRPTGRVSPRGDTGGSQEGHRQHRPRRSITAASSATSATWAVSVPKVCQKWGFSGALPGRRSTPAYRRNVPGGFRATQTREKRRCPLPRPRTRSLCGYIAPEPRVLCVGSLRAAGRYWSPPRLARPGGACVAPPTEPAWHRRLDRPTQCPPVRPTRCPPIGGHPAGHCVGRSGGRKGGFSRGLFVWRPACRLGCPRATHGPRGDTGGSQE